MTKLLMPCIVCGTPARESRCAAHGSRRARGYDARWVRLRRIVIKRDGGCLRCGDAGDRANPLSVDHIIPKADGGADVLANLQTLCRRCNSSKGDR